MLKTCREIVGSTSEKPEAIEQTDISKGKKGAGKPLLTEGTGYSYITIGDIFVPAC
jgi:hypothetical protein